MPGSVTDRCEDCIVVNLCRLLRHPRGTAARALLGGGFEIAVVAHQVVVRRQARRGFDRGAMTAALFGQIAFGVAELVVGRRFEGTRVEPDRVLAAVLALPVVEVFAGLVVDRQAV